MTRFVLLLVLTPLILAENNTKVLNCSNFQADFDIKSVIGPWYVTAIIPDKFPDNNEITCYLVEFSETEEAGLRWLVNNTSKSSSASDLLENIKGSIVRQRYHSEKPFDVWSKSVGDINGCFQQVLALDIHKSDIGEALTQNAIMQLHFVDPKDNSGPILLQLLWGKAISAVIYRRYQGATQYQLKPVMDLMTRLRGPQKPIKICSRLPKILAPKLT